MNSVKKVLFFAILALLIVAGASFVLPLILPRTAEKQAFLVGEPKYDTVGEFRDGYASFCRGGRYGLIKETGDVAVTNIWDYAGNYSEGLVPVSLNGQWFFCDSAGNTRITIIDGVPSPFSGGVAIVRNTQDKCALINRSGKILCDFVWDFIEPFAEDFSLAKRDGKSYVIDRVGKQVSLEGYDDARFTSGGEYIVVMKNNRCGLLSPAGKMLIDFDYDYIGDYSGGLINACNGTEWKYVTPRNETRLTVIAEYASPYHQGVAVCSKDGAAFLMDAKGGRIGEGTWSAIQDSDSGVYVARYPDGGYTYIDSTGKALHGGVFDEAAPFRTGYSFVYNESVSDSGEPEGTWTVIDRDMQLVRTFKKNISLDFLSWTTQPGSTTVKMLDSDTGEMGFLLFGSSQRNSQEINSIVDWLKLISLTLVCVLVVIRVTVGVRLKNRIISGKDPTQ